MIASGAMRQPTVRREATLTMWRGWPAVWREHHIDRVSIVDGEFCCLRPGTLLARARQAKGRAWSAAKRSGGQAARPPVAARIRALKGPVLKT
jgi:hypothetical protein